jgi:hypothetical protein
VACAPGRHGSHQQLEASAALITTKLEELRDPQRSPALRRHLRAIATERLGPAGASARQAEAIMELLTAGTV